MSEPAQLRCVRCGESLVGVMAEVCPRCGLPISVSLGAQPGTLPATFEIQPAGGTPSLPTPSLPSVPPYSPYSFGGPATPEAGSSGGQPMPPGYPSYGQGAPPSVPLAGGQPPYGQPPYGQPGASSMPLYGQGAPPGYPSYGQPGAPSMPLYGPPGMPPTGWGPPPPPPKSRTGLLVGLIATVLVVVIVGTFAAVLLLQQGGGTSAVATATATPTATLAPTATPAPRIAFQDPLTSNVNGWASNSNCFFKSDGYHVKGAFICYAPAGEYADADVSVQVKQIAGALDWYYGLVFRRQSQGNSYALYVASNGYWKFAKHVNGKRTDLTTDTPNDAIRPGLRATNTLEVKANGSHFDFFVNGIEVGSANDTTFAAPGLVGVNGNDSIEVVFTNLTIATGG